MKFKVGDKVSINNTDASGACYANDTGEVISLVRLASSLVRVLVQFDNPRTSCGRLQFWEDELELMTKEENTTFKRGDRVKLLIDTEVSKEGDIGTVESVDKDNNGLVIRFDNPYTPQRIWTFGTSLVSKIEPSSPVNKPSHYNQGKIEVLDFIKDQKLDFVRGNVVKYVSRAAHKEKELEDLKKARWYLDDVINDLEELENNCE